MVLLKASSHVSLVMYPRRAASPSYRLTTSRQTMLLEHLISRFAVFRFAAVRIERPMAARVFGDILDIPNGGSRLNGAKGIQGIFLSGLSRLPSVSGFRSPLSAPGRVAIYLTLAEFLAAFVSVGR